MFSKVSLSLSLALVLLTALLAGTTPVQAAAVVRYAAPIAQGSGNCSSWANACPLQTALNGAASDNEIWVQAGVYKPTDNSSDRNATFTLRSGVGVYGGFAGMETARDQRDWHISVTILSGDIDQNDTDTDGNFIAETTANIQGANSYHVVSSSNLDASAVLDGFVITAGQANTWGGGNGGGMINNSANPTLTNIIFSGNSATSGGGVYNNSSSPTLTNVTFNGNSVDYFGGGIYNYISDPSLTDINFNANFATRLGGGMCNEGSNPTLASVTFNANSATNSGGGLYNGSSSPTLTNVTFSANIVTDSEMGTGGGMANSSSSPKLANVTFSANSASYGGGVYNNDSSSSPLLTNVTFSANSAHYGGGMYNNSSSPTLTNVTFSGNSATNKGGGMYNYAGGLMLANVTFNDNTANYGGGIYNYFSDPSLTNVILWGDSAPNNAEIYNESSAPAIAFSDIQGGYPGIGNINADPLFVDAASGNLRLQSTSPVIDAGDDGALPFEVTTDLDGNPRFSDLGVDMGAYEYQGAPAFRLLVSIEGNGFGSVTSATAGINCPDDCTQVYAENTEVILTAAAGTFTSFDGWQVCDNPSGNTCTLTMNANRQATATFIRSGPGVFYTAPSAQSSGDCSSWANACLLQTALSVAISGDEIWVQEGLHNPTDNLSDLAATFTLRDGVAIYGGFAGTEIARDQRDWQANLTILSGDIDKNDTNTDGNFIAETTADIQGTNSYHVVSSSSLGTSAILDGFIITAGRSDTSGGGGMYNDSSNPALANLTFSGNSANNGMGGGMYNDFSNLTLTDVAFSGNSAGSGGGMYNFSSSPALTNVTFSGNSANNGTGGGIYNNSSSPTLTNVTFSENSALYGGGMYNFSSNPLLTNITFSSNTATSGGGMFNEGSSSPTLVNITFDDNSATNSGGGVYNSSSGPTLANVTFNANSANNGGGMYSYNFSNPSLTDVTFSGNSAGYGGGMYNGYSSNPLLTDVTFRANSAGWGGGVYNNSSSPTMVNITFDDNSATNSGGGIFNDSSSSTLTNVTFSGNSATNKGGGMYNYSGALMLANVTFNGNTANYGGGIYNYLSAPSLTNVVLWGDSAPNNAEIYNESSAPAIAFSDIQGGYPGTGNINADPLFVDAASDNLRLQSTSPAIDAGDAAALPFNVTTDLDGNPRFSDLGVDMGAYEYQGAPAIRLLVSIDGDGFGSVTSAPAGINCPGDCAQVYAENTPVTLTATDGEHSSFDGWQGCDNPSGSTCALVMSIQQQVTATFIRSGSGVFYAAPNAQGSGNCSSWANACPLQTALSVTTSGDEIWAQEGVHNPTDNSSDLTATFTLQDGVSVYGGFTGTESNRSQRDWQTNLTILSGDIDQNDSNTDGNFIAETTADIQGTNSYHVVSSSNLDASAVLDGFIITAGRGATSGGGMYNDSSSPTLANLTFSGNSANSGGGMFNNYGNPTLANITLNGNLASYGGGMYNNSTSPSPTLINVTFSNNSALDYGGGMLNSSSNPALTNVTFNNNSAADSGGGMFNVSSSPVLTNVTFDNNSAASYGGGIYNGSSNPTLTEVTFNSNSAYNGGGMCNYSSSPKLTHSAFNDNSATDKGGGIYNSNYSSPSLANVTFNINDANYGGGIYNNLSSPSLVNITFNANSATFRGGGVYNESSSGPTFANVILWGDSAPNGAEIYNNGTGTATVTYSNIQGGYSGTGNVNVNPLFVDASSGNLRLQSTSPVIDAGNNAAVPSGIVTDLDNNPRFVDIFAIPNTGNGTVDMGAYEAQWPFKIILPLVMRGTP